MRVKPETGWVNLGGASCRCCSQRLDSEFAAAQERAFFEVLTTLGMARDDPPPASRGLGLPLDRHRRRRLGPYKVL
jgi:hypothetical protein